MAWAIAALVAAFLVYRFLGDPARKAEALCHSARHARNRKNWAFAAKFYGESFEVAGRVQEPRRSEMQAQIELQWAWVLHRQGKLSEAEEMLSRALSKAANEFSPRSRSESTLQGYLLLGDVLADQGRESEAETYYRKALAGDEANDSTTGVIYDLQRLGNCLIHQERTSEAEAVLTRSIELETQHASEYAVSRGWDPDQCVVTPISSPSMQLCKRHYDEARLSYRSQIERWGKQAKRPDNIDVGQLYVELAGAEAESGHVAEAVDAYQRAVEVFEREWCPGHPKAEAARRSGAALQRGLGAVA